jgi:hypothetical protein
MRLSHHCLIGAKRNLVLHPNETGSSIIVNYAALKTTISRFVALTLKQSTRSPANKLICQNEVTNLISVVTECSLMFGMIHTPFDIGRVLLSLSEKA